jgi:hypothetical protein
LWRATSPVLLGALGRAESFGSFDVYAFVHVNFLNMRCGLIFLRTEDLSAARGEIHFNVVGH